MPLTDSRGQNIPYSLLTDKPNARTLGEGIVEAVVDKLVMVFASASVRGAIVTSPTEGMVSWLRDVGRLEVYDGSAWVTISAGTAVWQTLPLASGWTHGGFDEGPLQYRVVNFFGEPTIMFKGGISRASYPTNMPFSYRIDSSPLPTYARPSSIRITNVVCSVSGSDRQTVRLSVHPTGEVRLSTFTDTVKPPWVGFNNTFLAL